MATKHESTFLGSVKVFFESPLAMALVGITATFVIGELIIPGLLGEAPLWQMIAQIEQTVALVVIAGIGIHALAAELERIRHGLHSHRPLEHH